MAQFRFIFTARDYENTVSFFTDTMGLSVVHSWDDHGRGTIVAAADGQIEMFDGDASATPIAGVAMAWEVDDIDTLHRTLSERGVHFLDDPRDQPWGHRNATLSGPEKLSITLFTVVGDES